MPGPSRKRAYRLNVKCSICLKEIQEDNFPKHKLTKHQNNPLCKALIPVDSKQQKIGFSSKSDPNEVVFVEDKNSNIKDKIPDDPEPISSNTESYGDGLLLPVSEDASVKCQSTSESPVEVSEKEKFTGLCWKRQI